MFRKKKNNLVIIYLLRTATSSRSIYLKAVFIVLSQNKCSGNLSEAKHQSSKTQTFQSFPKTHCFLLRWYHSDDVICHLHLATGCRSAIAADDNSPELEEGDSVEAFTKVGLDCLWWGRMSCYIRVEKRRYKEKSNCNHMYQNQAARI